MALSEEELKIADRNAQDVVNYWGLNNPGNTDFTPKFHALFDKTDRYRRARQNADFYRRRSQLSETDEGMAALAEETDAWQLFAESFKPGLCTAPESALPV
jgi:hypothetical protein